MVRRSFLKTSGLVVTAGVASLPRCSNGGNSDDGSVGGDSDGGDQTTTSPSEGGSTTVLMVTEWSEYYFDPIGLFVEPGETVTFEIDSGSPSSTAYQKSNGPASVTRIPDGAEAWVSGVLSAEDATSELTFDTTGTYDYFCTLHKTLGMVGRIVVGESGGSTDGSMPPDGDVRESQTIVDQGAVSYSAFSG